ncbi:hypothetical protein LguiB_025542 [Lonicera macranthoides]
MILITRILHPLIFLSILIKLAHSSTNSSVSFLLACGSSSPSTDANGRNWIPDSKFLTSQNNSISGTAQSQDPSLPSTIPYMKARIFKSPSTYKFPISPQNRHWIRLHFYPSPFYQTFNSSTSFFSVKAGGFTLLNNFSASIIAQTLTQAYIIREFSLKPIQSNFLSITFAPSNGSFAFVNGIEVISMPEIFHSAQLVGFSGDFIEINNFTFQTMNRLNVGGQYIPPNKDSGLTRIWYDDSPYLAGAAFGVTSEAAKSVKIVYSNNVPNYTAPVSVYKTARSMGPTPEVNKNYNLTWVFQVDTNFAYLVRFHFCEFLLPEVHQRVFSIFINNHTAFAGADVIAWTRGIGVPIYKDFLVYVSDGNDGDEVLWLALHPDVSMNPQYYDSILNGLEIFKLNDKNGNLAGPNPVPLPLPVEPKRSFASSKKDTHEGLIGGVLGGLAGAGVVVGFVVFVYKKRIANGENYSPAGWLPIYASPSSSGTKSKSSSSGKISGSSRLSTLGGGLCRHFSLAEIKVGTKNFDESQVIGVGGFGKVYKGIIDGGTKVAIKRANPSSQQGIHEFNTEIDLLSKLRHRHLVSLIGACEEDEEMILVYDYMANGTLRQHLYNTNELPLYWKQRLHICIGAARGLHYLHTGAKYTIIHRDVKTTNILLDEKWVAKVSDFGLSKTGPTLKQTHISTIVKGSFGYLDPEYFRRQQLTEKSDVYSFGVVLFEVLCARPAVDPSLPKEQVSLADWALHCHEMAGLDDIIDPLIKGEINPECLNNFVDTAVKCLSDQAIDRPSMGAVLWNLEFALQLQNNPGEPKVVAEQKANDAYVKHARLLSIEEEEGGVVDESEGQSTNEIFSQIMNPQGK